MVNGATDIPAMNTDNGYSYDWTSNTGGARRTGVGVQSVKPTIQIRIGSENNADDKGSLGTGQYIDDTTVSMEIRVPFVGGSVNASDIHMASDLEYSKAIDDVKKRFGKGSLDMALCGIGVISFNYAGCEPEDMPEGEKHIPQKFTLRFNLKYKTQRWL
jgi:hypothetical protein